MHRSSSLSVALAGLLALVSFLSGACASTNLVGGTPSQVRFFEYRSGVTMAVVNESHTDRVELYSEKRPDASIKVASDELMDALIDRVRDVKFGKYAQEGSAPETTTQWSQGIEVQTAKGTTHMLVGPGIEPSAAASFRQAREAFLGIYNNIFAAQSVETDRGKPVFQQQPPGVQD